MHALPRLRFRRTPPDRAWPLLLPVREREVPPTAQAAAIAARFTGASGTRMDLPGTPRRLLFGLGAAPVQRVAEEAGAAAAIALAGEAHAVLEARGLGPALTAWIAAGILLGAWRFDRHRAADKPALSRLTVLADDPTAAEAAWAQVAPGVEGCLYARDLVSEPANHLTTRRFAHRLEDLSAAGIHVDVWGRKRLARAGFGALLAVGGGSEVSPPRLAILRWRGSVAAPPIAFVGKGLVFDTGGISIKPAAGMQAMRADMAGAAACAGAMLALARRQSPAPAVAVLALAENATGAASYRPGDVLRTASGRTVEVVDTDAEGRLVLADALHHAISAYAPRAAIDLATLTGAVISALGHHQAGLFGNDAALGAALAAAGEATGEKLWPLPIGASHRADLHSDIADIRQCVPGGSGTGWAGRFQPDASHAAAFLREFVGETPWAHLDIAGVDTAEAPHEFGPAGATGFGVRLLDRLVATHFEEADPHAGARR
jgi:leucyl aminopeptidase